MLTKLDDYKGVIVFYILLVLILIAMSYRSKQINAKQLSNPTNYSYSIPE